jgi:AcrR family transcriptional regulator
MEEGLRARKRRETRQRIAEAGLRLFLKDGFEATTLDAIAAAADISRRTFFHYFSSKEEVVNAFESSTDEAFRAAIAAEPLDEAPLDAVRNAFLKVIASYETKQAIAIDGLLRSTEALCARKQANYARKEQMLFEALSARWQDPERRASLRLVAMVGVGALRLAAETWSMEQGRRPLGDYLEEAFRGLRSEIAT